STFDGKVFRSTNAGANWVMTQPFVGAGPKNAGRFAFSPGFSFGSADQRMFLSGSDPIDTQYSTNAGNNWTATNYPSPFDRTTWNLAASPNFTTDQTLFAASNGGMMRSTDGGVNFSAINTGIPYTNTQTVAVSPNYVID